jgi:hypothetical protein
VAKLERGATNDRRGNRGLVRQLIEEHLAEENRKAALDWLDTRTIYYAAAKRLDLA